jgi:glycosyltransferase involved in cell wall biosynthesis
MKVTLVSIEYFHWGIFGGFGAFTRKLATELVKRGVDVEVFVSRSSKLQSFGQVDWFEKVKVITMPRIRDKLSSKLYDNYSDVVHEQYNPLDSFFAFRANSDAAKIVTIQDLRTYQERKRLNSVIKENSIHFGFPIGWKQLLQKFTLGVESRNLHTVDAVACQANLLKPKIKSELWYQGQVFYLPNFVDVPTGPFNKTGVPSVLWLGRLDPVKNPLLMFQTAKLIPDVNFYVLGKPTTPSMEHLVSVFKDVPNLHFLGHQEGNVKEELLSKSWILINTSYYECLPVSFLEALAHKCCLLSTQNPDGYTLKFGCYSPNFFVKDLVFRLKYLLKNDLWQVKAEQGYNHVKAVHETNLCVQQHLDLYRRLLS